MSDSLQLPLDFAKLLPAYQLIYHRDVNIASLAFRASFRKAIAEAIVLKMLLFISLQDFTINIKAITC